MTKRKQFFCDAFNLLGLHHAKFIMLVQLHMCTNEGCWEFYILIFLIFFLSSQFHLDAFSFTFPSLLLLDIPHCHIRSTRTGEML